MADLPVIVYLVAIGFTGPALATLYAMLTRLSADRPVGSRASALAIAVAASTSLGLAIGTIADQLIRVPVGVGAILATVGAAFSWTLVAAALPRIAAPLRRDRVVARLRDRASRKGTLTEVLGALRRAEGGRGHDRYARVLLRTIDVLSRAGLYEDVLELLDRARYDRINSRGFRYLAVYGALAHIHLGQTDEARNILDGIEGALDGPWEEWRLAIDAVAAAAVGRRREAKALASWISDERYALERAVAEAHTYAAEGRRADAQRTLMRVQLEHDDPSLESLYLVQGPATALATEVLAKKGSPFR